MSLGNKGLNSGRAYLAGGIAIASVFSVLIGVFFLLNGDKSRLRFGSFPFAVAFQFVGWVGGSAIVALLRRWLVSKTTAAGIGFVAAQPFTAMVVWAMQNKGMDADAGLIGLAAVTCGVIGAGIGFNGWDDDETQ